MYNGDNVANKVLSAIRDVVGSGTHPLHQPSFSELEVSTVSECIESTFVSSSGFFVDEFEKTLADFTGANFAISVVNGTSALHLALKIAEVLPGDEVLIPAMSFIATANAVSYCNAVPHFLEVDSETLGIDSLKLEAYLDTLCEVRNSECFNVITNRRIKALVPMHAFGHPSNMDNLLEICKRFNIVLIEDAAESLGSRYKDKHTGTFGTMGVFSFNGNKILTTGGGGAVVTDSPQLASKLKHFSTTGKVGHKWEFNHDVIGYNYRMPNLNAALGCAQFTKLSNFIEAKRKLHVSYSSAFSEIEGVNLFSEAKDSFSNYWLHTIILDESRASQRDAILEACHEDGIMCRPAWSLLSDSIPYAHAPRMDLTFTRDLASRLINIPSSPSLAG
jgi:perosamine synthetase